MKTFSCRCTWKNFINIDSLISKWIVFLMIIFNVINYMTTLMTPLKISNGQLSLLIDNDFGWIWYIVTITRMSSQDSRIFFFSVQGNIDPIWTHKRHPIARPQWASYGVPFVSIFEKSDLIITWLLCTKLSNSIKIYALAWEVLCYLLFRVCVFRIYYLGAPRFVNIKIIYM